MLFSNYSLDCTHIKTNENLNLISTCFGLTSSEGGGRGVGPLPALFFERCGGSIDKGPSLKYI